MPLSGDDQPTVSVILPARDEEANILAAVESLAAQTVPIELIAVDDDSTDRTGPILDELARKYPRMKVIHNSELPAGWVGKNHACWLGAQQATANWLLFTDADVRHAPNAVAEGMARAAEHRAAMVSFSPDQDVHTWWERAVMPLIFTRLALAFPYRKVNDPLNPFAAANGQWLLISREFYDRAGGHRAVRRQILEDVELARRVKEGGHRIRFSPARGLARTRMYRSFGGMWEGWSKNLYMLYRSNPVEAALTVLFPVYLWVMLVASLYWKPLAILAGLAAGHVFVGILYAWNRFSVVNALLILPGFHLLAALVLSSWNRHRRRGRVVWKGREYAVTTADTTRIK